MQKRNLCSEWELKTSAINCNDVADMPESSFILALEVTKSSNFQVCWGLQPPQLTVSVAEWQNGKLNPIPAPEQEIYFF